ncbi:diguanylate cyclase [Pseudodesulfovibrio sp.]|uniref:GGDEF domain-containing response regulator n=1 Tax=unclassified Pseudodesulfovibrio TaxID=2661612 RepID=UPI003B00CE33
MRKILLVDDDTNLLDALALSLRGFDVEKESNSSQALDKLRNGRYAVVISDMRMPGMDGVGLLRAARLEIPETVRIMLTGHGDLEIAQRAINSGGVFKFMLKPVDPDELRRVVTEALEEHERKMRDTAIRENALHDELTGLTGRTLFLEHGQVALARARRNGSKVALLFIDLDGFKDINDTYGHIAGDKVLTTTAERIRKRIRESDRAARFGGDEFIVMLADIKRREDARTVGNALAEVISEPIYWMEEELAVCVSIGIAFYPTDGNNMETIIQAADEAMYRAKRGGGCKVEFATEHDGHAAGDRQDRSE